MTAERFQVDLTGLVDLLSTHLYAGPSVYIRELLQNAVDAIAARSAMDPDAQRTVHLEADGRTMRITDTGVGLTADEARRLLSTIASSSKRDELLGGGRREFLGQFGIGLLSAFTVAQTVTVESRSARSGFPAMRWVGAADGTFTVTDIDDPVEPVHGMERPIGTTVTLTARLGFEHWLEPDTVRALAREYGGLLDVDVSMEVEVPGIGRRRRRLTQPAPAWLAEHGSPSARERAISAYCAETFGFEPMAAIDLAVDAVGLTGAAFVLPAAVAPGAGSSRVHLKRMLLGANVPGLLPDWAFFVRTVVDTDGLTPSASREQLRDDEVLAATREELGRQVRAWVQRTVEGGGATARRFLETHHLALRAMALVDDAMLDLVARVVPFETTQGFSTIAELAEHGEIVYAPTTEAYRSVASVATAQGLAVVNAGYVYDADLLARLGGRPGWATREFVSSDLQGTMHLPSAERETATAPAIARARELLADADCDVLLRVFEPADCPAVLLRDADAERRRDLDREREATPDLWGGLLDSLAGPQNAARTRTLALNDASPLVRALLGGVSGGASGSAAGGAHASRSFVAGLRAVYSTAVLLSGEPLRGSEATALNDALTTLLAGGLGGTAGPHDTQET